MHHIHKDLPPFYYLHNFEEQLAFVVAHYHHIIADDYRQFIDSFAGLSEAARCLYVRMANRKGTVFMQPMVYAEISDAVTALAELRQKCFVRAPVAEDAAVLLHRLDRSSLFAYLQYRDQAVNNKLTKKACHELMAQLNEPDRLTQYFAAAGYVIQCYSKTVSYLQFLYHGRIDTGTSRLSLRDLGIVKTTPVIDKIAPRFIDANDAATQFFFAWRIRCLKDRPSTPERLANPHEGWPAPTTQAARTLRDKYATRLGKAIETTADVNTDVESAREIYAQGNSLECAESVVRLLIKDGRRDQAEEFLLSRLDSAPCDIQSSYLLDLYERKFCRSTLSATTQTLRSSATITLDFANRGAPELAAVSYYQSRGQKAWFTENHLWQTLFGLLFWELLFDRDSAAVHSPFDSMPVALASGTFYRDNENAIEGRLATLANTRQLARDLLQTSARYYGTHNGIFRWRDDMLAPVLALLLLADTPPLMSMLRTLCRDFTSLRDGYPDLLVQDEEGLRFIEIKAEGDQLRRNQLHRIRLLQTAGFRADVVRVTWQVSRSQLYSVVDIETTGGRSERHRMTEIGIVKVRDGTIIDRFQTLINPQRPIPTRITRLTGISDTMVKEAPVFADVAGEVLAFLQDSIFVAHSVNFDYGFIKQELRQLGIGFSMTKLCTCASMRKLFPGHASYSLAALTQAYDIALPDHHRALCDAEAATELLFMINERRYGLLHEPGLLTTST